MSGPAESSAHDTQPLRPANPRPFLARFWAALLAASALSIMGYVAYGILSPFFADLSTVGHHDWDSALAYRFITVLSLQKYGEAPFWHPYLCGGYAGFAYAEGAPNLVSVFLPLYLFVEPWAAIRFEIAATVGISLIGTMLLARRYTRSMGLAALVAIAYSLNGRWALQISSGHSWHMQYAYLPWVLYFLELASEPRRSLRWAWGSGVVIAVMFYQGGIYPVPHAALCVVLLAAGRTLVERRLRPLLAGTIAGVSAMGMAAAKLLPLADLMLVVPRKIDSNEVVGPSEVLAMLAGPNQGFSRGTASVPAYGWHEWGMYVGVLVTALALAGLLLARGPRLRPLQGAAALFWLCSFGAFHEYAPWALLHKLPVFSSHHVPSRFMYAALLLSLLPAIAWIEQRFLSRMRTGRGALEVGLLLAALFVGLDISKTSTAIAAETFVGKMPKVSFREDFQQRAHLPYNYHPPVAWAGPSFPAMKANDGFLGCFNVPDRADPKGALPMDGPAAKGLAYFALGKGTARVVRWSPNHVEVEYEGAEPGDILVYNMNFERSWKANGMAAIPHNHAVATRVDAPAGTTRFHYRPRLLGWGVVAVALTTLLGIAAPIVWGFARSRRSPPSGRATPLATGVST